jgi:hypothetical protein
VRFIEYRPVEGVDEHETRNVARMAPSEEPRYESAVRVRDQDVRRGQSGMREREVQLGGELSARTWKRSEIAETVTRAIVRARASKFRNLALDERPQHG